MPHDDAVTRPDDLDILIALEHQRDELLAILTDVERLRRDLVPVPEASWTGMARRVYADAMLQLSESVDRAEASLRSALARTSAAFRETHARV